MKNVFVVTERMVNRSYLVHVRVSKKTGKVLSIRAGCRRWDSFEEALEHYGSKSRWGTMQNLLDQDDANLQNKRNSFKDRTGALLALCRAAARVRKYRKWVVSRRKSASRKKRL